MKSKFLILALWLCLVTSVLAVRQYATVQDSVQSAASGANYVILASHPADQVCLFNTSGTTWRVQRVANSSNYVTLATGMAEYFKVEANSNELQVRRDDGSNTQVTMTYEAELKLGTQGR